MTDIDTWKAELRAAARPEKIAILSSFFKTGKGEYGEGDRFIGLPVPANRAISRRYHSVPLPDMQLMLDDEVHELRLAGLLALVERYKRARGDGERCQEICEFYLANTRRCNNWDLVDLSAQYIIGEQTLLTGDDSVLYKLVESPDLWEQRIAITSTLAHVRRGRLDTAIALAELLADTPVELLQKATGWVLREVGKKDKPTLLRFLDSHAATMPRTMLRYAIEKFGADDRTYYMQLRRHLSPTPPPK